MSDTDDEASAWLAKGRADLAMARALAADSALPPWGACYHAQQSAEKAIKALLVLADVDPPKSHNLRTLVDLLTSRDTVPADDHELADLTRWAIVGRYPAPFPEPSPDDARAAIRVADRIIGLLGQRLDR